MNTNLPGTVTVFPARGVANKPANHYGNGSGIEPIDLIKANGDMEPYCKSNIIKYVSRYQAKNGLEDLQKAKVYLDWLITEVSSK